MDCYCTAALPQAAKGVIDTLSAAFPFRGIQMLGRCYPLRNLSSQSLQASPREGQYKFGELNRNIGNALGSGVLLHSHYLLNHG